MTNERWQQVEALFHAALEREPNERSAFLARECAGDESMRLEVESLLASHDKSEYGLDGADLAADFLGKGQSQSAVGRAFGPYKVLRPLAAGGMGAVFIAQDTKLGRQVALKLLPSDFARDRDRLRRFEQEARATSALNHPNIVTVYDAGDANGIPFIAMELVDGTTLRQKLARGRLKVSEALEIAAQVASALGAAHRAGIIHRDIKPANLLLRPDGYVKVVDFGLSKLTARPPRDSQTLSLEPRALTLPGFVVGTPHYMSPEQASGAAPDCRTDIFSLGVVLYEMLCESHAFKGNTAIEVMGSILNEDPPDLPPDIPARLQEIVRRCLEKQPERRFQSAEDLAFTLRAVGRESVPGKERTEPGGIGHAPRWGFWIPAAAVLLSVLVVALFWWPSDTFWKNPLENAQFSKLTDFEGAEINGAISSDGKFVVFLSDRDGPFDVWVTQLGSGQFNNLTRGRFTGLVNDNVQSVGFSHDAATVWVRAHDGKGSTNIWLFPTLGGGGNPRLFLPGGAHAAWMPDGSRLLYAEAGGGDPLFVADRDGSNPKRVFLDRLGYHAHFPTWSLDGSFIYFVRGVHMTRQMDLWRIPAAGGHPERITDVRNWIISPTVLDDRTLLYTAPAEDGSGPWLYAVDVTQGEPHRISLGVEQYSSISATSSGKRLVATVASWTANLRTVPITDLPAQESEAEQVVLPSVRAHSPRYGPDYFLYLSSHGGPEGLWKFKKGEASELWKGSQNGRISAPAISSDGRLIAFTLRKQGRGALYTMTADGTGVRSRESLDVNGVPSWSPDAKWIAVIGDKGEGPRLFKIPMEAGTPVQLTDDVAWNPVWSPDGSLIVYVGAAIRFTSRAHLSAVSPAGKPIQFPRELWVLPMDERYRFTPDGRGLVIMRGDWRMHQFFLLDLDTFSERPLSNLKPGALMRSFDVSPDGKHILFDRLGEESDIVLIDLKR